MATLPPSRPTPCAPAAVGDTAGPAERDRVAGAAVQAAAAPLQQPLLRWSSDGVVVIVRGEVDCTTAPQLAAVRDLLTTWGEHPVVDASGITFIDIAGLRAVLALGDGTAPLRVLSPSAALVRLIDVLVATDTTGRPRPQQQHTTSASTSSELSVEDVADDAQRLALSSIGELAIVPQHSGRTNGPPAG